MEKLKYALLFVLGVLYSPAATGIWGIMIIRKLIK